MSVCLCVRPSGLVLRKLQQLTDKQLPTTTTPLLGRTTNYIQGYCATVVAAIPQANSALANHAMVIAWAPPYQ